MANPENLKPFTGVDDPRRHNGRPKGIKNWSTIVQEVLGDEEVFLSVLKDAPSWVDKLPNKNAATAIAVAMQIKAMGGDTKAADWLRKTGFGDKLEIEMDDKRDDETLPVLRKIADSLEVKGTNDNQADPGAKTTG